MPRPKAQAKGREQGRRADPADEGDNGPSAGEADERREEEGMEVDTAEGTTSSTPGPLRAFNIEGKVIIVST